MITENHLHRFVKGNYSFLKASQTYIWNCFLTSIMNNPKPKDSVSKTNIHGLSQTDLVNKLQEMSEKNLELTQQIQITKESSEEWHFKYLMSMIDKGQIEIRLRETHIQMLKEWNKVVGIWMPTDLELKIMSDKKFEKLMNQMRSEFNSKLSLLAAKIIESNAAKNDENVKG